MTTATAIPEPSSVMPIGDQELNTLWRVANAMAASRLYKDAFTAQEAFARILAGRDLGLSPSDSMKHMQYIDGEFQPSAEIQASLLKSHVGPDGERYDYRVVDVAATKRDSECKIRILRREADGEWERIATETYTVVDAERAEITDSEFWRKHPRRMLWARAMTTAIDRHCPEVIHPRQGVAARVAPDDLPVPDLGIVGNSPDLPTAEEDPIEFARVDDPGNIKKAQLQHIARRRTELAERGELAQLSRALDAVGAIGHVHLDDRIRQLDENQATEVIMRIGRGRRRRRPEAVSG